MTADVWALSVYDKSMVHKVTYSWTSDSITLDGQGAVSPTLVNIQDIEWEVTPNENSLWATWMGDSNGSILDIDAQDRIVIWTKGYRSGETTTTYYPRGRFYCSIPANADHIDGEVHQYRALGIAELLKTTDTGENHEIDEGQDLASGVADTIITNLPDGLPAGISHTTFSAIGVSNTGKINPDSADLYQNLDAIATLCAIGGLSVAWGVKPDGTLFLEQTSTTVMNVNERRADTTVTHREPQADEIVSAIRWIIADGTMSQKVFSTDGISLATPDVLTHLSDSGITTYGKRVKPLQLPQGVSGLKPIEGTWTLVTGKGTTVTGTAADLHDNDPTSYAVKDSSGTGFDTSAMVNSISSPTEGRDIVAVRIHLKEDDSGADMAQCAVTLIMQAASALSAINYGLHGARTSAFSVSRASGSPNVDKMLVWGDRARDVSVNLDGGVNCKIEVEVIGDVVSNRVGYESLIPYQIDTEALDALAEAHYKFPQENAFKSVHTRQLAPGGLANLTKDDGTTVSDLPVEAIGYRISGAEGVQTFVTVGPRLPSEVAEEFNKRDRKVETSSLSAARAGMNRH